MASSSMNDIIRMLPEHFGHESGSTKYTFWMRRAQFFLNFFLERSDSIMVGAVLASEFSEEGESPFLRMPLDLLE